MKLSSFLKKRFDVAIIFGSIIVAGILYVKNAKDGKEEFFVDFNHHSQGMNSNVNSLKKTKS